MHRIFALFAAVAISIPGWSAAAQQSPSGEQAASSVEAVQAEPTQPPPPFPPMPREHRVVRHQGVPHEHYPSSGRHQHSTHTPRAKAHHDATRRHSAHQNHHAAKTSRKKAKHETTRRNSAHKNHQVTHERSRAPHLSKQTISQCHKMTYKQIVQHKYCRQLMEHDLDAKQRQRHESAKHKTKSRHSTTSHRKSSKRHHSSAHHRG